MAVHTYVGARYIPRFVGTYDPTQIYDALDVVDNGSGTSYIARQTVPAGTPLTDTDYWFVYGASSGAIIALQNDMIQAQNDILGLQNDLSAYETSKERNIVVIGNSYVGVGCVDDLLSDFDHSYRFTSSGVGFVAYTGHTTTFEDLLDNAIASSSFNNDTITDIIFVSAMGDSRAVNEGGYAASLDSTLASMETKINAAFTNCKRRVIVLAESRAIASFGDSSYRSLFLAHRYFKTYSNAYGYDYIGFAGFNILFQATMFESDNYHPNANGAKRISTWIYSAYHGRVEYVPMNINQDAAFKYTNSGTIRVIGAFTPDDCQLSLRRATLTYGAAVTIHANETLVDMSGLTVCPPPPAQEIELCGDWFNAATGASLSEFMRFKLSFDSSGIACITLQTNPNQSTAGAQYMQSAVSQNIVYRVS